MIIVLMLFFNVFGFLSFSTFLITSLQRALLHLTLSLWCRPSADLS